MRTRPSASSHAMSSSPPSSRTVARRPHSPRRCAATRTAQAPVPQARVIPAPRSHTRMRSAPSPARCAASTLAPSGNNGSVSTSGPSASRSTASASGAKNTACGLPMLTAAGSRSGPAERPRCSVSRSSARGMSRQPSPGAPMSTRIPPPCAAAASVPAAVSRTARSRPLSAISRRAAQRAPLPHAAAAPPSALNTRMKASARAEGSSTMTWSQPIPVRRSATARASSGASATGAARPSNTAKSLPSPCILTKRRRMGRRIGRSAAAVTPPPSRTQDGAA